MDLGARILALGDLLRKILVEYAFVGALETPREDFPADDLGLPWGLFFVLLGASVAQTGRLDTLWRLSLVLLGVDRLVQLNFEQRARVGVCDRSVGLEHTCTFTVANNEGWLFLGYVLQAFLRLIGVVLNYFEILFQIAAQLGLVEDRQVRVVRKDVGFGVFEA